MAVITIPQPAMAVHSYNVPSWKYEMYNTWYPDPDESMEHICDWITTVAKGAPGGRLRCLVFNSHGSRGRASLSKKAVLTAKEAATHKFSQMKGYVDHVVIVACKVIGASRGNNNGFWSDSGVNLVYALAGQTGARVYASNQSQYVDLGGKLFGGKGDIDELEGDILCMPPSGYGSWLPSNYTVSLMLKSL